MHSSRQTALNGGKHIIAKGETMENVQDQPVLSYYKRRCLADPDYKAKRSADKIAWLKKYEEKHPEKKAERVAKQKKRWVEKYQNNADFRERNKAASRKVRANKKAEREANTTVTTCPCCGKKTRVVKSQAFEENTH